MESAKSNIICLVPLMSKSSLTIKKAATPPSINGIEDADEWSNTSWVSMVANCADNTTWGMSSMFKLMYDDSCLYILTKAVGNTSTDTLDPSPWYNDCFEIFLKIDTTSDPSGIYEANGTYHFRLKRASIYPDGFDVAPITHSSKFITNNKFIIKQINNSNNYTQEWQIPWTTAAGGIDWNKNNFKFEIQSSDNTGIKRTQHTYWQDNSDLMYNDTRRMSVVALESEIWTKTISGNAGIAGATIKYGDISITADGSGNYSFKVTSGWSGTVTPVLAGYNFTPSSKTYTNVTQNYLTENYTANKNKFTISGNAGVAGAKIDYGGGNYVAADNSGNYSFTVLEGWSGTVTPVLSGYTFAPSSKTYTNISQNYSSQNYAATKGDGFIISGNAGIAGVKLKATNLPVASTNKNVALVIDKVSSPPKIDGIADGNDPWLEKNWVTMTANKSTNTTSRVTAKFQFTYDDKNLYCIINSVGDTDLDTSSVDITLGWENDCVEIMFQADTVSAINGEYNSLGAYHFRMRRSSVYPNRFEAWTRADFDNKTSNFIANNEFKIGQSNSSNAYTQEWQMPWKTITDETDWNKKFFKCELQISDNTKGVTGGRTQQLFWKNNSDLEYRDTRTFSIVELGTSADIEITTDASGNYSFTVPTNWSGTVTPTKEGYKFTPESKSYTQVTSNKTNQNFTVTKFSEKPIITPISNLCPSDTVTLKISNSYASGKYFWHEESNLLNRTSAQNIRVNLFERKYTVYDSSTNQVSDPVQITWNQLPNITSPPKIYAGGVKNKTIYFATDARGSNLHYIWHRDNEIIPSDEKYYCVVTKATAGIYFLEIKQDGIACSTYSIPDTLVLPTTKSAVISNISLSPNPAKNDITINIGKAYSGETRFLIYDMMGRNWKNAKIENAQDISFINIPLTGMPKGYYCIEIINPFQPAKRLMFIKQ
jgi:hypothetical protein